MQVSLDVQAVGAAGPGDMGGMDMKKMDKGMKMDKGIKM